MTALLLAVAACSREPAPVVALPPALESAVPAAEEATNEATAVSAEANEPDQHDDGLSAAAGLPQPLSEPLVEDMRIEFEYGTLFEFQRDPLTEERQVSIEPIGTPVEAALDSLAASLMRAGFEPLPAHASETPLHRLYRNAAEPRTLEIELLASAYAEPELAAHPGGTGSVVMHLRAIKSTD